MKQKQVIFRLTPSWQQSNLNNILSTGKIPLFPLIITTFACFFSSNEVILAQVIPDNSINTQVNQNQNVSEITGGETQGNNLFHSFQNFSIPTGNEVFFDNASNISNIFSRVTSGNISNIDGLIRANDSANLFLINPAGIVFTENARLDIGGSFLATTADSIKFGDGEFSAIAPEQSTILLDFPIGLGFGSSPGDIIVEGLQNNVVVEVPSFKVNTDNLPPGIKVNPSKSISLIGGNINFSGGGLQAPGGNIELIGTNGSENIDFISTDDWFNTSLSNTFELGNINFTKAAYIDVSGEIAGNINISGREISLDEGSVILANTSLSSNNAININASEALTIQGTSGEFNDDKSFDEIEQITAGNMPREDINNNYSVSLIGADIFSDSTGTGNNININTKNLQIFDGGEIRTVNFSADRSTAGDINVNAENIVVEGTNNIDNLLTSVITSSTGSSSRGNGGDINISTQSLQVLDGGRIKVDSFNVGSAGNLSIESENILLSGSVRPFIPIYTGLIASSPIDDDSGNIGIKTSTLSILDGARISTATFGQSNAGEIDIEAELINVSGFIPNGIFVPSSIVASVELRGNPNDIDSITETNPEAGLININTAELRIFDGGKIEAVNNVGSSGDININAENIELNGTKPKVGNFIGGISTSTGGSSFGNGGDININTGSLRVINGSIIRAISLGDGDAGNITIDANTIEISEIDRFADIPVVPQRISKINTGSLRGNGGNISINSDLITVNDRASIGTSTRGEGDGGNLEVSSDAIILTENSAIAANANNGSGGNVSIDSDSILGIENSDITANSVGGNGGNITISSNYIFGLVARNETTEQNDITASSELGLNGDIQLVPTNNSTSEELISSRQLDFSSSENLVAQSCFNSNTQNTGTLLNYGSGGITENPNNYFDDGSNLMKPTFSNQAHNEQKSEFIQDWQPGDPVVEANEVKTSSDGNQYLVARTELQGVRDKICQYKL
ncbi:filamentous hemagglutinin N-terminal domain-containing protein [Waterburya agarophytonicola K14]|uniref:Filamentous hemagglutinin N-terminal domain-containing protein n=1 Tax=Waterburya agarophytonicola KI4 TaxID=2874699 RepID=A0A964FFV6_9CYAN|nr:filamentous hemagglutinin N-terminal domain-containing protein [Waterburya agarophytonicola]MCC0175888.1 filamentous hemagglutinin N-terminal domain-containing protein [Waterburya agarophytonicola KI4]